MKMGIRLHDDGMRRSDSFSFNRNPSKMDQRTSGLMTIKVDDREYSFTVPSSLFKYTHGLVDHPSPQWIPRPMEQR